MAGFFREPEDENAGPSSSQPIKLEKEAAPRFEEGSGFKSERLGRFHFTRLTWPAAQLTSLPVERPAHLL